MTAISWESAIQSATGNIRRPLRRVAVRRAGILATRGLLATLTLALAIWLPFALLLGYFRHLPNLIVVPIALVAWFLAARAAWPFLRPMLRRHSLAGAAREIEQSRPELHERLSSAIELISSRDERFSGSRELLAHLIKQAEQDAAGVDAKKLFPVRAVRQWAIALGVVLVVWIVLSTLAPRIVLAGLYRTIFPWRTGLPTLLAGVNVTPGDVTVTQGDSVAITIDVPSLLGDSTPVASASLISEADGRQSPIELTRTGPRSFHAMLESVQKSFRYRVNTDRETTTWFTVTVQPRPSIASLQVHYDYPSYANWKPKTTPSSDGSIEALQNTQVTLLMRLSSPVAAQSHLTLGEPAGPQQIIPLMPTGSSDYTASFIVKESTHYRIEFTNEQGLGNRDNGERSIIARPDQPPTIRITSPTAESLARLTDVVPIQFEASDDFAVAKIDAIVQVDDQPPQEFVVKFDARDPAHAVGTWELSVPYQLSRLSLDQARTITYQLRATDNRDPQPQSTTSEKQTMRISEGLRGSWAAREDEARAANLAEAIRKAIDRLNQSDGPIYQLRSVEATRVFRADERQIGEHNRDLLVLTSNDLADAAKQNLTGGFATIAEKVQAIATGEISTAADDAARCLLDAENAPKRTASMDDALRQTQAARQKLNDLLQELQRQSERVAAAHSLVDLAARQEKLAKEMDADDGRKPEDLQKQQQIHQELYDAMSRLPELQKQDAAQNAQRRAQLARQIDELANEQRRVDEQSSPKAVDTAQKQKLNALAEAQKKLDADIGAFADQQKQELDKAHVQTPEPAKLDKVVQELARQNLNSAVEDQRELTRALALDADKLHEELHPAEAAVEEARDLKKQADDAAAQLPAAGATQPADAVKQKLNQLAQQISRDAEAAKPADAEAQVEAQTAQMQADAAEKELAGGHPDQAAAKLQQAAQLLEQADQKQAAQQPPVLDRQAEGASREARDLQNRQQQLAEQTDAARQPLQALPADQAAQQEQQLAQRSRQSADEAQALEQQSKDADPELAERAQEAQQDLHAAADEQKQAADDEKKHDPDQAADEQAKAEADVAKAQDAVRGLPADPHVAENNPQDPQPADQSEHPEAGEHHPQDADHAPEAGENHPEEGGEHHPGASGEHPPEAGQPHAGEEPGHEAGHEHGGPPHSGGGEEAGHPGSHQGQPATPQTPEQSFAHAAQRAQEANDAMDQAQQGSVPAAQEAAQAMQQASAQLEQAMDPSSNSEPPGNEPPSNEPPSNDPGHEPGSHPGNHPGQGGKGVRQDNRPQYAARSNGGADVRAMAPVDFRPDQVKEIGISPSDWALLPAPMQQELLNAAQQSGPPGYQEAIKNYYVRIAHLEAEEK